MSGLVSIYENQLLDNLTGKAAAAIPVAAFLALFTSDPTDAGLVVSEITEVDYERIDISSHFPSASGVDGKVTNTSDIAIDVATTNWPEVTHIGVMASSVKTTADMISSDSLDFPITIVIGHAFIFRAGTLSILVN